MAVDFQNYALNTNVQAGDTIVDKDTVKILENKLNRSEFKIKIEKQETKKGIIAIVRICGELDIYTHKLVEEVIQAEEMKSCHLVIDFQNITYADSTGLGTLIGVFKKRQNQGAASFDMCFINVGAELKKCFNVTGLTKIFKVFSTLDEVIKYL